MSAVVAAVFADHDTAVHVRTRLVKDGFPTDRVELTSTEELGQAEVVPQAGVPEKLTQYFSQLFPDRGGAVNLFQGAVLAGHAVIAVHPRGDVETNRVVQLLNENDPVEVRAQDLDKQPLEQAASKSQSSALSWIGKTMVAPRVPHR
jgi:hypothetical protein